jgi:hypothetical protein
MRLRLFRASPSLANFSSLNGYADPERCVRRFKLGKPDAFEQIENIFGDSLLYIATEILPEHTPKKQIGEAVVGAFRSLWNERETFQNPGSVKSFLHRYMLDACQTIYPDMDRQSALMVIAFSEIARVMVQTEHTLPKKFQRFYRMKFIVQRPDDEIAEELALSAEDIAQFKQEIRAFITTVPKWG